MLRRQRIPSRAMRINQWEWTLAAVLTAMVLLCPGGPAPADAAAMEQGARGVTPQRLANYPRDVIYKGSAEKQAVTLMINVDWGTPELEKMLPVLKRRGVKVTFFVSGTWAEQNRDLLRRMAREGHEIATHGYKLTHGPKELARTGRLKADISQSVTVIEEITGQKVRFYAPHMSEVSPEIVETAASLQLRTVLPSLDTVDWHSQTTPQRILTRLQKAGPGDLILMHPKPNTAQVLDAAIQQLTERGLKPVTLTEMLSPNPQAFAP